MNYYDCEYYDEPNEFERQVSEFKQSLANAVKREHQKEMERLRKENTDLQDIKSRMEEIEMEHVAAIRKLNQAEKNAEKKSLAKLLENARVIMYAAGTEYIERPKCDKCNDNRQIEFVSPSGRKMTEDCECSNKIKKNVPKEIIRTEFWQRWNDGEIIAWYRTIEKSDDHVCLEEFSYGNVRKLYDGTIPYDELDKYSTMFKTEEACQRYCDWLNNREVGGTQP